MSWLIAKRSQDYVKNLNDEYDDSEDDTNNDDDDNDDNEAKFYANEVSVSWLIAKKSRDYVKNRRIFTDYRESKQLTESFSLT